MTILWDGAIMKEYKVGDIVRILTLEEVEEKFPSIYGPINYDWFKSAGNRICEVVTVLHGKLEDRCWIRDVLNGRLHLVSEIFIDSVPANNDCFMVDQVKYEAAYITFMFGENNGKQ